MRGYKSNYNVNGSSSERRRRKYKAIKAPELYGPNTNVSKIERNWAIRTLLNIYSNMVFVLGILVLIAFLIYRFY